MTRALALGLLLTLAAAGAAVAHADVAEAELVVDAAVAHGVDPDWMLRIARCESGLNRYAVNRSSGAIGLFQLLPERGLLPAFYRRGYADPLDPAQQSNFAAEVFAAGGARNWTCH